MVMVKYSGIPRESAFQKQTKKLLTHNELRDDLVLFCSKLNVL